MSHDYDPVDPERYPKSVPTPAREDRMSKPDMRSIDTAVAIASEISEKTAWYSLNSGDFGTVVAICERVIDKLLAVPTASDKPEVSASVDTSYISRAQHEAALAPVVVDNLARELELAKLIFAKYSETCARLATAEAALHRFTSICTCGKRPHTSACVKSRALAAIDAARAKEK